MILEFGNREFLHEWGVIPIFLERKFLEEGKRLSRRTLGKACVTGILALLIARDM